MKIEFSLKEMYTILFAMGGSENMFSDEGKACIESICDKITDACVIAEKAGKTL